MRLSTFVMNYSEIQYLNDIALDRTSNPSIVCEAQFKLQNFRPSRPYGSIFPSNIQGVIYGGAIGAHTRGQKLKGTTN